MTPQEISDYKMSWLSNGGYSVRVHSDLDWQGKNWCRKHLGRHQWSFRSWTDVYEHTFIFEDQEISKKFESEFQDHVSH